MIMVFNKDYIASVIFISILFAAVINLYFKKKDTKTTKLLSNDVAEAMANKIIFEAKQHRQIRTEDEYIIVDSTEKK